jgi:hypothetical protein
LRHRMLLQAGHKEAGRTLRSSRFWIVEHYS